MAQHKRRSAHRSATIPVLDHAELAGVDLSPLVQRAREMLVARPGLTIGVATGVGFLLGMSMVSKLGRVLLVGAMGIGAELLQAKMRAGSSPRESFSAIDHATAS